MRIIQFASALIVSLTGEIVPNRPGLVLFSTRPGRLYEDNSRYLYEYILENEPQLNPVWITHEKEVYNDLSAKSLPVQYAYSLGGIWTLCRASVAVTTHGKKGLAFHANAVPNTLSTIMLGHGDPVKSKQKTPEEIKSKRKRVGELDYFVTTSEFTREFRLKQLTIDNDTKSLPDSLRNKFITTGYPRTDLLLDTADETKSKWNNFLNELDPDNIVLYAPTKHYQLTVEDEEDDPAIDFFPFSDFEKEQLYNFLEETETLVLFRPHPRDVRKMYNAQTGPYHVMQTQLTELCGECEYVRMATQYEIADTTELLPFVDILITDYSSIYHDFLILDRPILFIPYDYEVFKSKRGFNYGYYEHLPGPEISSFSEFQSEISDIYNGIDQYRTERQELRNLIHKHQDGRARERLTQYITQICYQNNQNLTSIF